MTPASPCEAISFHPLELIPYFRRFPSSRARNLVYTFIWNTLLGCVFLALSVVFSARLPSLRVAGMYFVLCHFIGYAIHALFQGGHMLGLERWARSRGFAVRTVYFSALSLLGVITGFQAVEWIFHIGFGLRFGAPSWIVSVSATSIVISLVLATIFFLREREARAQAELALAREKAERLQREAVAADLRALQAQVEPHFLFNTLANVASLVDRDPRAARHMLERFIRFLRASLAATRTERTTLGAERELIAAYLDVLQERMGERLRYTLDIPAELEAYAIPPMLLQPLVENAIRHGLEPNVDGGTVELHARREGEGVTIEVRDSGVGFAPATAGGLGLTNLRDRLRALWGERASLAIADNPPSGTVVTLKLPA